MCAIAVALLTGCGQSTVPTPAATALSTVNGGATFEENTRKAGLDFKHQIADGRMDNIMESDGAGGCVLDYDGDGFMDVYLVNSGPAPVLSNAPKGVERWPNRLFRNRGDGTFEDVTTQAGIAGTGFGTTAVSADYDNDGDADLVVVNFGGLILYRNEGNGVFKDATGGSGLTSQQAGISACFFDADKDGHLDLFVADYLVFDPAVKNPPGAKAPYPGPLSYEPEFNLLYRNRGDGTFEDISERSGIRVPGHRAMSVTALDYDLDGDQDLYVSNDGTANLLLANDGTGRFKEVGLQSGVAVNQFGAAEGSMGSAVGDCTGDGLPDLFVTRFGNASLYVNSKAGFFDDRVLPAGILAVSSQYTGWGGNLGDVDNDGDLDLLIVNGSAHFVADVMPPLLFENRGDGTFTDASNRSGPVFQQKLNARGCAMVDLDNDGHLDVVVTTLGGPATVWRNLGGPARHWLTLKLEGTRSNRDALGARVQVRAGALDLRAEVRCATCYVTQQDSRLHFGLGSNSAAERIEIHWPSGQVSSLTNVTSDQVLKVVEPGESRWTR